VRLFGEAQAVRAKVFTHGEPLAANALCDALRKRPGWRAQVARAGQAVAL
jgi:hypothetical protein